jgi:hypothetical protein
VANFRWTEDINETGDRDTKTTKPVHREFKGDENVKPSEGGTDA